MFEQLSKKQSIFWSYLVLSDISVTAASAGEGDPHFWKPQWELDHAGPRAAPAPAPLHGCCGAAELQPSEISCERGLVFFQNSVYYRFHDQFSLDLCRTPVAPLDMCCLGGTMMLALGEGGGSSFQLCRLGLPGSSASLPRWP